jgi:hypothetical protein
VSSKFAQAIGAFGSPLLTLACTALAAIYVVNDELRSALGAALAGLIGFVLLQLVETLPKKSLWWRRRFEPRAAFEGWWLQIHEGVDRASVFSFEYGGDADQYQAAGDAFNTTGEHLAHWESTDVFFSTGLRSASYLWEGTAKEAKKPKEANHAQPATQEYHWVARKGSTKFSIDRSFGRQPTTGLGEVHHLNLARAFEFRVRRVDRELLAKLKLRFAVDDLGDFERRKELAKVFLGDLAASSGKPLLDDPRFTRVAEPSHETQNAAS